MAQPAVDWTALLPAKPLLRVQEVAATLNCSVDHVYRLLATGQIQAAVDLRRLTARRTFLRILRESVLAFLQAGRI